MTLICLNQNFKIVYFSAYSLNLFSLLVLNYASKGKNPISKFVKLHKIEFQIFLSLMIISGLFVLKYEKYKSFYF